MVDPVETPSESATELIGRDTRALFGSAGLAVLGQGTALLAGLACTILTIRLLPGRADYGRYALFFMFLEVVSHLVNWPNLGLVRFGREELGRNGRIAETFWARLALFLLCVLLAATLLFGFSRPLDSYLALDFPLHYLLIAYVALNGLVLFARSVFQTVTDFRAYASTLAGVKLLNLAFLVVFFVLLARGATPGRVLLTHLASFTIVGLACLLRQPWRIISPPRLRLHALARIAAYSWPLFPAGLSALVVNWVDFVVIRRAIGDAAVGIYAVAYQPVIVLITLSVALMSAVQPLLISLVLARRRETLRWYHADALRQVAWALGLAGVLLAVLAEFIPLIVGRQYGPAVVPCQVLIAGVTFFMFAGFQSAYAKALDRVRWVLFVGVVLAVLNTLFDLALVPAFGIRGAAVATTAAYAMSGLFYFPILSGDRRFPLERPLRAYSALIGLAPTLCMAAAALALPGTLPRVVAGVTILLVWAALGRWARIYPRRTLEMVRGVHMPAWARRLAGAFYRVLGS